MSRFTQTLLSTALTVGLLGSGLAYAKVSPEEAARLGQDLTPMGAEKPATPTAASRPGPANGAACHQDSNTPAPARRTRIRTPRKNRCS